MADQRLSIRLWSETFLTSKTRNRNGRLRSVQLPVRLDDPDYIAIASRKDGAQVLGVWMALVELAGSQERRDGVLARSNDSPFTLDEISSMTHLGYKVLQSSIDVLIQAAWLIPAPIPNSSEQCGTIPNAAERVTPEVRVVKGSLDKETPPAEGGGENGCAKENGNSKQHQETADLCKYLGVAIRHWKPDARISTASKRSFDGMDRLLHKDGRKKERVLAVLDWLFGQEAGDYEPSAKFNWQPNIKSGASLREHWDQIESQFITDRGLGVD